VTERVKPIYLFADSQLLFWRWQGSPFLLTLRNLVESQSFKAAYVGASNDNDPAYYGIFEAAIQSIGVAECRMVSNSDITFVEQADLVLLSGGDVDKGWRIFEQNGLKELLIRRYHQGVLLVGSSAGAVQLGMLGLVPYVISAHDEKDSWAGLKETLRGLGKPVNGIGIPTGAGMVYHADRSIEAIRYPLHQFSRDDGGISEKLILPTFV
jgi:cyanophycinase